MPAHVLIVDDEETVQFLIAFLVQQEGYRSSGAASGEEMHALLRREQFDLIILDLQLPDEDGLVLARQLRARSPVPIIVLTATTDKEVLLSALEIGVDDFITKPFEPRELILRIKNNLARAERLGLSGAPLAHQIVEFDGWTLDRSARMLSNGTSGEISLTPSEYNLLEALLNSPNRALSRDRLLDAISQGVETPLPRMIDVYVSQLRKKVEVDPRNPKLIKTVRGYGYKFNGSVT
jgi:DNA-binding response OmpR family regulator